LASGEKPGEKKNEGGRRKTKSLVGIALPPGRRKRKREEGRKNAGRRLLGCTGERIGAKIGVRAPGLDCRDPKRQDEKGKNWLGQAGTRKDETLKKNKS